MTREEKSKAIEAWCDDDRCDENCPLWGVPEDEYCYTIDDPHCPCDIDRNYAILVKAGCIKDEEEEAKQRFMNIGEKEICYPQVAHIPGNAASEFSSIKDSGNRREFDTGAVRDMAEGKGRCDLLPAVAILRLARHFEKGAIKYSDRNWEKGIPLHSFIDSAIRHTMKYLDGQHDEDHLCAAAWNLICAMWTEEKHPELNDLPWAKEGETSE